MKTLNSSRMLAFSAVVLASAATSARAETINCTPITSVPYIITVQGVYCFTDNIATSMSIGNAIEIQTNNVTLDLNGFKLGGLAAGPATAAVGIFANERQNVTIRNGIVRGFYYGIWLQGASPYATSQGHVVEDLVVDQNTYTGIDVRGRGCVVRRNQVVATGGTTVAGSAFGISVAGPGSDVLNNRVAGTTHVGSAWGMFLFQAHGSVVEGNRVGDTSGGTDALGIALVASTNVLVAGNRITTAQDGISFSSSTGKYMDNLTSGVTTPFTGGTPVGTNN